MADQYEKVSLAQLQTACAETSFNNAVTLIEEIKHKQRLLICVLKHLKKHYEHRWIELNEKLNLAEEQNFEKSKEHFSKTVLLPKKVFNRLKIDKANPTDMQFIKPRQS